eukprot:SAG11_NODE_303_length_11000_cov_7.979635_9_plen_112_part_00
MGTLPAAGTYYAAAAALAPCRMSCSCRCMPVRTLRRDCAVQWPQPAVQLCQLACTVMSHDDHGSSLAGRGEVIITVRGTATENNQLIPPPVYRYSPGTGIDRAGYLVRCIT